MAYFYTRLDRAKVHKLHMNPIEPLVEVDMCVGRRDLGGVYGTAGNYISDGILNSY